MNRVSKTMVVLMSLLLTLGTVSLAWAGASKVTKQDGVLAREEEIEEAFIAEDDGDDTGGNSHNTGGNSQDTSRSNDNTGSRHTSVSRDRDRSRGDRSRDWTRDGGDKTRDHTGNKTNDGTRNDTR